MPSRHVDIVATKFTTIPRQIRFCRSNEIQSVTKRGKICGHNQDYAYPQSPLSEICTVCRKLSAMISVDLFHNMRKSNHNLHKLLFSHTQRSDSIGAHVLIIFLGNLYKESFVGPIRYFLHS